MRTSKIHTKPWLAIIASVCLAQSAWANGPGLLKFDQSSFSVIEETGAALITVARSQGEDGAVSVDFETIAGTATAASDFVPISGTLSWADLDESTKTFEVQIIDDIDPEGGETIQLLLSNPTGGATLHAERFQADLVILASDGGNGGDPGGGDDGAGSFKFDEDEIFVSEDNGVAVVLVERSGGGAGVVTVDYLTSDGTATAGADYSPASGTLTWANGDETAKSFSIPILDDAESEGNESIELTLSNPTGGADLDPLRDRATVTIAANDGGTGGDPGDPGNGGAGSLKFDESSFEVLESVGVALVRVERSGGDNGEVSVTYETFAGSATDGLDFTPMSGTLTWFDQDETDRTFAVPILDDDEAEGNENIHLLLSNPTNGATIDPLRGTSEIIILANDGGTGGDPGGDTGSGTLKFSEDRFFVSEEAGIAVISIERSQGETGVVTVEFSTGGGSASEGLDYSAVSGTLTWGDADGSDRTIVVPILDDLETEGDETVMLDLHNATGGASVDVERGTAELVILASEGGTGGDPGGTGGDPGLLKFGSDTFQVLESGSLAIITVERSQGEGGAASVSYRTLAGSATDGLDYSATSGTLSWVDGDGGIKSFAVPILDDADTEGNETIQLELFDAVGASLHPARFDATLTIIDDDAGSCTPDADTMCLQGGRFRVEVSWTNFEGQRGSGKPVPISDGSGLFWFFDRGNIEMLTKVLDGCSFNQHFWVFASATTNVGVETTITDTHTGISKTYTNPVGRSMEPIIDTEFFGGCL